MEARCDIEDMTRIRLKRKLLGDWGAMIITRTPFRVSFFGGGTDYPAWYRESGGAVLATTIDKYCYISCRYLPPFFEHKHRIVYSQIESIRTIDEIRHPAVRAVFRWANVEKGLEVHHDGDLPARSGLGSSSSFTVGLLHALRALVGVYCSKDELAQTAIHIEQDLIGENVGCQDQISAAYGGFNRIDFLHSGDYTVSAVVMDRQRKSDLQDHLMLFFTGLSRFASDIARDQIDNMANRRTELRAIHQMVDHALKILNNRTTSLDEFGLLLNEAWRCKRSLSDRISNPQIDDVYQTALGAGALGGKLLGAGGGGFLLIFARPERQPAVRAALSRLIEVPFRFENFGSSVVLYQPNGL
jgi:D-glycero-alpha-D-manno-heptose-7-phosphate kinase